MGSFLIFQGWSKAGFLNKTYSFVVFKGGVRTPIPPLDPRMLAHVFTYHTIPTYVYVSCNCDNKYRTIIDILIKFVYSKTCVKRPLSKRPKKVFKTNYRLMQVKSIAECSKGSIMQCFRLSLKNHMSLRSLFCLFLSGRFTQVLLYASTLNVFAFIYICICYSLRSELF